MLRDLQVVMDDQRLLASAALFRQLHDLKTDTYEVLSQFIRSTIVTHKLWTFDVTECAIHLNKDYGFNIPEAVIKTCLNKRLKKNGFISYLNGRYSITQNLKKVNELEDNYANIKDEQEYIRARLIKFVELHKGEALLSNEIQALLSDFCSYFIMGKKRCEYTVLISQFILESSEDSLFVDKLNNVEEGLILYSGISYSSELVNIEPWRNDFQIILDTEVLFDAVGLNGEIQQHIFTEFNSLVKELQQRSVGKSKIELCYFDETKREIDNFFYAAEKIIDSNRAPDPSKSGMIELIKTCSTRTDVLLRKIEFYDTIHKLKINPDKQDNYYINPMYNFESNSEVDFFKKEFSEYETDKILDVLKIFTKVNTKRKGINGSGLEKSGALLITGKNITKNLAYNIATRDNGNLTPFASDIDFITERLWFKLHKGFGNGIKLPTTFDVVARAQVILSAYSGEKIADNYKLLIKKVEEGTFRKDVAAELVNELRSKNFQPEDFCSESVGDIISFMQSDMLESALRNKSLLEEKAREGVIHKEQVEILNNKVVELDRNKNILEVRLVNELINKRNEAMSKRKDNNKKIKVKIKVFNIISKSMCYLFLLFLLLIVVYFAISSNDTVISVLSLCVGCAPFLLAFINNKRLTKLFNKYFIRKYKKMIGKSNIEINIVKLCEMNL